MYKRALFGFAVGLGILLSASCAENEVPKAPGGGAAAISGAPTRLIDRSVEGPYVSIYARYRSTAPANRVQLAFFPGTRLISDARRENALRLEVAMSALDSVLPRVRALPWIVSTEVDTSTDRTLGAGPIDRSEFLSSRRMTQEIPWGVWVSGGPVVDSATGNEGGSIKVAVIDAGVDCDNSDLTDRVYGGYDFALDYSTGCGFETTHGTAVAGILAATNDAGGVVGMAPTVHLYSYVVTDGYGVILSSTVLAEAIDSAVADGARVINISLGNCGANEASAVDTAVAAAIADSIIVVAGAGDGAPNCSDSDPVSGLARLPGVIGVSSFDSTLVRDTHGQYGPAVAFSGPEYVDTDSTAYGYAILHRFDGTSAAAPHASGAFALALAAGYTRGSAISRLETYARPGPGQSGKDNYYGYGEIDAAGLLASPTLDSVTWCTDGNITNDDELDGGSCLFTARTTHGAPPVQADFTVVTSVLHDTTEYGWGALSREIYIPRTTGADSSGYTMTVITYVRDSLFRRPATDTLYTSFYVCDLGALLRQSGQQGGPPAAVRRNPDLPAGCH